MVRLKITLACLALLILASCRPEEVAVHLPATATPFKPVIATPTPYLPSHPTLPPENNVVITPDFDFHGIDFTPGAEEITLRFWPESESFNHGRPIKIRFLPGSECIFGDHQACINHFRTADQQEVIWVSVHSGVTGEGQELRHALEGTGINSAGFSLEQVLINLEEIKYSTITLQQGQKSIEIDSEAAFARVPAAQVPDYLSMPFDQALQMAFSTNSSVQQRIKEAGTLLVIETCGWRMPGEEGWQFVSDTTASIYLGILD